MKRYLGVIVLALWASVCSGKGTLTEGVYLIDDIQVVFDNNKALGEGDASFQKSIVGQIKSIKDNAYFNFMPTEVIYYTPDGKATENIKAARVQLNAVWHTIKVDGEDTIRLVSDKKLACAFYDCQITLVLKKTTAQAPALIKIKQHLDEREKAYQARLVEEKDTFNRVPMDDFPGIPFSPAENFTIKLPFKIYDKIKLWEFGIYIRRMERLLINRENKNTRIYSYHDRQHKTDFDLFVVSGKKSDFNLASWLKYKHGILFQSDHGAAYYNESKQLETVYFQYDEVGQRYFFGLANAEDVTQLARAFAVLRTMDVRYRGAQALSMRDVALSQQALEEKYGIKIADELNAADLQETIWKEIDLRMAKPERFIKRELKRIRVKFPSDSLHYDIYFSVTTQSIPELMAEIRQIVPKGEQLGDVFIYGNSAFHGYEYNVNVGEGLRLQFMVPHDAGTPLERLMFLHVLQQLDLSRFPAIAGAERNNLFKYDSKTYASPQPEDRYFSLDIGLLDGQGNLIISQPDDGVFEFKETPPYILAIRSKTAEEGDGGKKHGVWVFDEKGKLLHQTLELEGIVEQRLAISGDGKKLGLYDLKNQQWRLQPAYEELSWHNGVFLASHIKIEATGSIEVRKRIAEDLLDKDGRVLATGHFITVADDRDRVIVTGEKKVSLMDKQGRVLLTRSGDDLEYVSEINAYALKVSDSAGKHKRVGIISEQGEIILPVEYGGYLVYDGRLEMSSPDFTRVSLFEVDKIKDWRNHQPLRAIPFP
ncbi:hypothetical protein [Brenneria izadpanahii]|uniref:hypothetical protein n=1 Tax=Brenneria izadpanahii TaxID=2722756 RepID=UPI001FE662CE|nr:hypothetical protein [Brenneria izadpanahii]